MTKENQKVEVLVTYKKGLSRYYGLLELAEAAGIFKKVSTRYELPDGAKQFGKTINENPEQFFTEEVLQGIEKYVQANFLYGSETVEELETALEEEIAEIEEVTNEG